MITITAGNRNFADVNAEVRNAADTDITIMDCTGQRYIASGLEARRLTINGVPGNALGAYLAGTDICVHGNVQDATGDTMNDGLIVVHGSAGDATGYSMRGGAIYVRGNTGYRAGIHMKEFKDQKPAVVVGGKTGSFLGEYQAGGTIIVLGLELPESMRYKTPQTKVRERALTGAFCGTGMHGGAIYLRIETPPRLPSQVSVSKARGADIEEIQKYIDAFCGYFSDVNKDEILNSTFCVLKPNSKNPYKQMYTHN